ncbi:exodeoxyribonuclease III [Halalkalibacillus halophilus]|uniref:exodeoxyribonuclease III n=1 Tax=Halalkalibacillus halophilus TaxID=392827 RepID=UPI0003FF5DA1|nr:exodeoxyribonuclease III [Halalkalibacillus halophilus]
MKLISWNVNGLRACVRKGFLDYFHNENADIFAVQEIKLQEGQINLELDGYYQYFNYAERKGYSGTAVFSKQKPVSTFIPDFHELASIEGRVLGLEFESFYLLNVYTPNSQRSLDRLPLRIEWEEAIYQYIKQLEEKKPVIICGDLNVAHQSLDVKNDKSNKGNSGFTYEERSKMDNILATGYIDVLRYFYPERDDLFTWWSYMKTVRERNIGWRIDYFLVSTRLEDKLVDFNVDHQVFGSDHCPIKMKLNL